MVGDFPEGTDKRNRKRWKRDRGKEGEGGRGRPPRRWSRRRLATRRRMKSELLSKHRLGSVRRHHVSVSACTTVKM